MSIEGQSTTYLTINPQICQNHQNQGKSEVPPQVRGSQRNTTKSNVVSWMESMEGKRPLDKH